MKGNQLMRLRSQSSPVSSLPQKGLAILYRLLTNALSHHSRSYYGDYVYMQGLLSFGSRYHVSDPIHFPGAEIHPSTPNARTGAISRRGFLLMSNDQQEPLASNFPSTQWTQVIKVIQEGESAAAAAALAEFCERYRPAVYSFFRRRGCGHDHAQDYTQEFFRSRILKPWDERRGFLHTAERRPEGRFRSFLCHVLWRFLQDQRKGEQSDKAGGAIPHMSLDDLELADESAGREAFKKFGSEFDRVFALEIIQRAAERSRHSKHLLAHLKGEISQKDAANELGLSEGAFKAAYHRFRERLARDLWDEVAKLAGPDEKEIRAEIEYLMRLFGEGSP